MLDRLGIFKTLFKGREDVFSVRREKEEKAGYMPAYDLNWNEYAKHKAQGGSLKDFHNKSYQLLTDDKLNQHLSGKEIIGIYPLLQDNTSWFIAADFDQGSSKKKNWAEECQQFITECKKYGLPVYLEKSRSGQGAHVWMFFDQSYPAYKSRKIFLTLLANVGIISGKDRSSNFDRLFPNQDYHSGKGLGNLIALPFQKKALETGNSCFINPNSLEPFDDQWSLLKNIQKIPTVKLNEVFNSITQSNSHAAIKTHLISSFDGEIHITLNNLITIPRHHLNQELIEYLKDNLNFMNADFLIRKKAGKSTYQTEAFFKTLGEKDECVVIPRGFIGKLLRFEGRKYSLSA